MELGNVDRPTRAMQQWLELTQTAAMLRNKIARAQGNERVRDRDLQAWKRRLARIENELIPAVQIKIG